MDNAAAIMESTRICFQNDIKINPDGTKNIKALMVTQKDKIDELEQDVTKNENSFTNTTNLIKNLNESVNKIFADFENRTNFTNASEEYKTNIIPTAETIDTFILDLNNAISSVEVIFNEYIEYISKENEQIYNSEIQSCEQKEKELATELEKMKQIHIEDDNAKEAIAKENIAIRLELEHLNKEVESYEQKLNDVLRSEENINNQKHVINMLNDKCKWYDNETLILAKSYDSIISQRKEFEENISKNIENCKIKINELEKESQHAVEKLKYLKAKEENSKTELLKFKGSITDLTHLLNKSVELNKLTLSAQESFDEEMHSYQEKLSKIENLIKCHQEIGSKLSERIETKEIQMKQIDSDITTLKDIVKDVVDKDVCRQIELKQYHLQELETMFQKAQDAYLEKQKVLRAEITEIENGIKKIEKFSCSLEKELEELQNKTIQLEKEKKVKENILKDLQKQIKDKREIPRTSEIIPKKISRWDSDSTIEGEEIWMV